MPPLHPWAVAAPQVPPRTRRPTLTLTLALTPTLGKDLLDISLAFSAASSLIFSWLLAAALCGACREDWLFLEGDEHAQAPLGP